MKRLLFASLFFSVNFINAQIGINTSTPRATLDVTIPLSYINGTVAGVSFPQLTGDQIETIKTTELKAGTLVYATSIATSTIKDIDSVGYWYWTGDSRKKWEPLFLNHKSVVSYFYAPSIALPTSIVNVSTSPSDDIWYEASSQKFYVKLFEIYKKQYSLSGDIIGNNRTALKNPIADALPILTASDMDYFVTYFDNKVFNPNTISLDNNGILSYQIIDNAISNEDTYMNIVFKVK